MKKMFSSMMERFAKDMSEEDKKKMKDFGEKMAGMCSCITGKEMPGDQRINLREEKKAMAERVMTCCGDKMEMMSSFFKKMGTQPEGAEKPEKA
jgi:hypothetical protein